MTYEHKLEDADARHLFGVGTEAGDSHDWLTDEDLTAPPKPEKAKALGIPLPEVRLPQRLPWKKQAAEVTEAPPVDAATGRRVWRVVNAAQFWGPFLILDVQPVEEKKSFFKKPPPIKQVLVREHSCQLRAAMTSAVRHARDRRRTDEASLPPETMEELIAGEGDKARASFPHRLIGLDVEFSVGSVTFLYQEQAPEVKKPLLSRFGRKAEAPPRETVRKPVPALSSIRVVKLNDAYKL